MKICIDPGHGGYDPGAIGSSGLKEKDITLAVALKVAEKLRHAGVEICLTRNSDQTPWESNNDLQMRCDIANSFGADYFVSIHCNSAGTPEAKGAETYCYKLGGKGEVLAKAIQTELIAATGRANRGVKTANYYVLRCTNMPAVLTELAFISNPEEERLLADTDYQEKCATAIARAIGKVTGIQILREVLPMFKDVPQNHWAASSIERLAQLGIVKGDEQGNFYPDRPITRAEVAALLDRVLKYLGR
ncbi:N-acetylmuramoyl-L-alanine amidase [Thermoanaerobacter sp. YS13]|uniref:N-acetylmuramoyl-L-alanine amidase n=1 Tax=Thermoanaerobacter sp. YS13 TaxID=1511746 RepID=UPI000574C6FE|nr:N-acetylmuramoyl-L-alanine amidase [Thermoanaerobacter sp. YS13]KHO62664.1 N-acetylmuramoyl-L-alanine amidase [Thermoanaerobacter sp. YS13]